MKCNSSLTSNERSVGSELITEANIMFNNNDWGMKSAVGELSLKSQNANDNRNTTLFPDIIIFKDESNLQPLMGWELKMPDVSINDEEFISNARDKANRLGTGAFVLWNYQYVSIYIRNNDGSWDDEPTKFFSNYCKVLTDRKSVSREKHIWKKQLEDVLIYLNKELVAEKFKAAPIEFNISTYVNTISDKLAPIIASYYTKQTNAVFRRYIEYWVKNEKAELSSISDIDSKEKSYLAFAKSTIIKWINRIIFSHLIKIYHNGINDLLVEFSENEDIKQLSISYNKEVDKTDFYTILNVHEYETILPAEVISSLNEFNFFLSHTEFSKTSMDFISNVLENIVDTSKRELMGLYTTPDGIAKLLVYLTVKDVSGEHADLTVGSGTIAKNLINYIANLTSLEHAHNHVWASDKYNYPLQIANLAITSPESINMKNIVFQSDAFDLYVGTKINIVNPKSGETETLDIPKFNCIISNLPFISSNNRDKSDDEKIKKIISNTSLDKKSDLYQMLLLKYKDLIDNENGSVGAITSNSWFKTQKNYNSFYKVLLEYYEIEYILYSNGGRWFLNADIVPAIVILRSKKVNSSRENKTTKFISLNINPRLCDESQIDELTNSIIFEKESNLYNSIEYSYEDVVGFINLGLSMETLFDNINWILDIKSKLIPLRDVFESSRGVRTGADKIFITDKKLTDDEYTYPIIKSMSNVNRYVINETNHFYFYTKDSKDEMKIKGNTDTLKYIKKIKNYQSALKRKENKKDTWFQADQKPQFADFATSINPEKRFFWVMFKDKTVVNQRATAFRLKDSFKDDKVLIHALLNTSISIFILMGSGFGRALGATDLTKDGISQSYFLNPDLLSKESKRKILEKWEVIKNKKITNIDEQLDDTEWIEFNKLVYKEFDLPEKIYDMSKTNILRLLNRRLKFKEV